MYVCISLGLELFVSIVSTAAALKGRFPRLSVRRACLCIFGTQGHFAEQQSIMFSFAMGCRVSSSIISVYFFCIASKEVAEVGCTSNFFSLYIALHAIKITTKAVSGSVEKASIPSYIHNCARSRKDIG